MVTENEKKTEDQENKTEAEAEGSGAEGGEGALVEGGAEGEAPPAGMSKKKKMLLIALVVIVAVAGAGTFFFFKKHKAEEEEAQKQKEAEAAAPKQIYTDMDEMIVNLNTEGKSVSFMKLKVTLELDSQDNVEIINKMMPRIRDVFQVYLRELRPADMQGSVGLYRLREELLLRINKIVYPAQVKDILFKEVLVQ